MAGRAMNAISAKCSRGTDHHGKRFADGKLIVKYMVGYRCNEREADTHTE